MFYENRGATKKQTENGAEKGVKGENVHKNQVENNSAGVEAEASESQKT